MLMISGHKFPNFTMDKSIFILAILLLFLVAVAVGDPVDESYEMQRLEEKKTEIEQLKEEIMAELKKDIMNEIALTRQGRGHSQIAFTAGVGAFELKNLGDHHTIVFDYVITQIGNTYSPKTGVFTAPFEGAYVFTLTVMVDPSHRQYLEIVVDGVQINDILADARYVNEYVSTTKQWIVELKKGSKVWIRTTNYYSDRQIHGNSHTLFSGFLLFTSY